MPTIDEKKQRELAPTEHRQALALERIADSLDEIDGQMRTLNDHLFQIRHGGIAKGQ